MENLKNRIKEIFACGLLGVVLMTACSSSVTLADMQKQEEKAQSELADAREELIKLTEMKENYSEDHRDAKIAALKARDKAIDKDIERAKSIEAKSAQSATEQMIAGFNDERNRINAEIKDFEKMNRENWQSTRDSINREVAGLQDHIVRLTKSLADDTPVK